MSETHYDPTTDDFAWADAPDKSKHEFLPVAGHPDDDECTWREDGTDRTYCGGTREEHDMLRDAADA